MRKDGSGGGPEAGRGCLVLDGRRLLALGYYCHYHLKDVFGLWEHSEGQERVVQRPYGYSHAAIRQQERNRCSKEPLP